MHRRKRKGKKTFLIHRNEPSHMFFDSALNTMRTQFRCLVSDITLIQRVECV